MPTNEARKVDSWDEEVTDVAPKQVDSWDEEVVDEPVKKKVTPSPSQTQSSLNGLNLLSGVIPSGKALLTGQKEESAPTEQKQIDLTNAPIAEDESTRTDKFIRKPIDKKKVDEIYTLSKQNESLVDEFSKSHFVLDNLSQTEAIKQLNDLYAKREQAKDPQTAQAIDNQIEVIKSQPVEKQPSIQEAVLQNAQKYGSQPQDFSRPEIPMTPLTPNQILERNGMKTANTVGELHDRYIESATKLNELRPELDRTATELDAFKKDARTADFKTDKSGNKTLEGLADIPEAFGHGFGGTMKSIEQGFVNLLGDKQDRIDYAKKRYLEDNILYPTRTKGMATSGSEMVGGVAPYVISTAVLPQTALLGHVIINGLTMGASGYGNGYYEMFAKQKQQGASDEESDAIAMQNAKFEGAKETAIGASLPFMGGAGSKLFLAPAEKSAMKQFLATQGVIIPTFTAGKLASNVYQKYGLGEKDVNLGDGLAETAENGLILGAMMEFAHKAPTALQKLYRVKLSDAYPEIQVAVDKAVKDGAIDASQGYVFTEKLKRDFAVFNAMPKDITTEQKLAIEPEVKQIIELSSREPSAVESPEVTKDKIVQLQKQVAEKLGTPLTEKEMKSYEKLQEINGDKEDKLTPSEKLELKHYEKRIKTAEDNEVKLAEEKKVAEAETHPTNVGVEEGSVGVGGAKIKLDPDLANIDPIIIAARNGDKKAQEKLEEYGLDWEQTTTYRFVGQSEVDVLLANNKVESKRGTADAGIDVTTSSKVTSAANNEYRVTFKESFDLNNGLGKVKLKSKEEGDHHLEKGRGYDINDVAKIERIDENGNVIEVVYEQSIKETTKAETPTKNAGVEAGSGGVGGDGKKITITGYRNKGSKDVGENGTFYTQSEQDRPTNKKEISFDNALVLTDEQVEQFEGLPNEYLAYEWFPDVDFTKEAKRQGISESGHLMDKMVTEEAIKRGYDGIVYGTNEIVDLRTHPKAVEQSLKETTKSETPTNNTGVEEGSGVGGEVETFELVENEGKWKATTKTYKGRETGNWVFDLLDKKQQSEYEKIKDDADSYGTKEQAEASLKKLKDFELKNKEAFVKAKEQIDNFKQAEEKENKDKTDRQKLYDKTANQLSELSDSDFEKLINLIDKDVKSTLEQRFGDRIERKPLFSNRITEDYHKAKADGSNPELVKAVEQSIKETTQSETKVAEKGVEEPLPKEIKTAIDNGEITREQVDGFTEQDESAIEDIERKAESENEAELNSAIDQADKLIGEATTRSEGKTESSNEKVEGGEVKKTLVTKRAYEGSFREGVKKELEAIGLTRETENFDKAEVEAKKFFDEYGEDVAIEAMKAKDIEGALGAFVWNEITKSIDKKLSEATDIAEIEQLQKKQAEMLDIWGKQQRSGGAFNAAMAKIYENSDLGYSYEKQKDKWEGKFGEPMPKDIAEKFKQYDTELSDLKKRITEAEKKVKEAEEKQAFDNIVAEVRQKTKTERSGRRKIAEGLDELTNALGVKLSAVGDKKASATKALIKIGEGLIEEGIATAKNVAEKIREYVEDKFKGKIDIKEYEPDVLKHFEETLPKITERNGKIHIPDKLIKDLVKNGAETIEDLVSQVKEIAKEDFPDITDREIRDSITKYGKTQNPTKDEILSKISRMKRIGRLISQLEDVQNKIRPLKSGLQRERMDAEERAMNKQLREELRNLPVDEETLAGQIRTVLDARTKGIENRIEDLQREIDKGEKIPKNQRTIEDNQKVKDLREQLEKVKAEHQEKFAEQNEAEKEAKRLSMAKKNTQKRIEDLSTRLREGNFSKVEKKELKEDSELTKLRAEKIRIQEEFDKEFHKQELLNKKGVEKLKDRLWEVWSLPRVLMATGEMSFVGVQGLINTIAHPIESAKGLKRAFEFAFSEKKTEQWLNEIKSQDYYPIMKKSKLSLTELNAELTAREELFYSGWTNMIWDALGKPLKLKNDSAHERWKELNPMRGVERASVGYLDTQRVSRFLDGMEMLKQKGITYEENPQAYKDVADVVNTFTGRASLGKLEMIAPTLSKIFFSPRNWASALKTATPYALYHFGKMRADADGFKPSTAQKMVISDLSKFVGFTTSMVMMAAAILNNDDDESTGVEFDPRSSDFMKIKIGDIRIDPWGGKIQQIIFSSRVMMDALHGVSPSLSEGGYKKKGEVMPLGVKYKSPTLASLSATQATNKLAPTMALLNRYASTEIGKDGKRKDAFGNEFELSDEAVKMLKPIYWGTVGELLKEDPSALNGLLAFYAFFGGGVNIYGKKKEKKKD